MVWMDYAKKFLGSGQLLDLLRAGGKPQLCKKLPQCVVLIFSHNRQDHYPPITSQNQVKSKIFQSNQVSNIAVLAKKTAPLQTLFSKLTKNSLDQNLAFYILIFNFPSRLLNSMLDIPCSAIGGLGVLFFSCFLNPVFFFINIPPPNTLGGAPQLCTLHFDFYTSKLSTGQFELSTLTTWLHQLPMRHLPHSRLHRSCRHRPVLQVLRQSLS